MKKLTMPKWMPFMIAFAVIIAIGVFFSFGTAMGAGIAIATGAPISGTVSTETATAASPELLLTDISKKISKIRPDDLPLDTVLREIGAGEKAQAWKVEFYENTTRGMSIQVNEGGGVSTDATGAVDIAFDDVTHVNVDDVFYVPGIYANGSSGAPLRLQVLAKVVSTKTLTCMAINGTVTVDTYPDMPAIANDTVMYRIGNAKNELAAQNTAFQMLPNKAYNYCQIHMSQVEEGVYESMMLKEVDYGLLDFKADSIYDHRLMTELTALYGTRNYLQDPVSGMWKHYSGGLKEFAGQAITYSKAATAGDVLSENKIYSIAEQMFADNNGSDSRLLLVGAKLMTNLMTVPTIQKQVEANKTEIKYGVKFNVIDTAYGQFYLKLSKAMGLVGHSYDGFIVDPTKVRRRELKAMAWRELKLKEAGTSLVNAWVLEEAFCPEFRHVNTHATITAYA
jgi:hypothetical protein